MSEETEAGWIKLLQDQRWAALGSVDEEGHPFVSSVAFAQHGETLLMHLSQLAAHTGYLQGNPASSLLIAEPDSGVPDPQTLARFTLVGSTQSISRDDPSWQSAARAYLLKFPEAEMRFGFADFHLFQFTPERGNYVGGFGKAGKIAGEKIRAAMSLI